jgi:CheY-like chemotaxis protein
MDMQMPVIDSFTATRTAQRGVTIPIVALTANAMIGFEQQILNRLYRLSHQTSGHRSALHQTLAELLRIEERQLSNRVWAKPAVAASSCRRCTRFRFSLRKPPIVRLADNVRFAHRQKVCIPS